MVDRDVVATKIATIRDAIDRVRGVVPPDVSAFVGDRDAREIAALNLMVAVQECIDLAAHWIADAGRKVPGTQREMFAGLADQGLITAQLAERLAAACGMRNVIAHQYGTIDWIRVHAAASSDLDDLESLCHAAAREALDGGE